jgi:hypothetical protein
MYRMSRWYAAPWLLGVCVVCCVALPIQRTEAVVYFGGPIRTIVYCINSVTYTYLGAPRGGAYIWGPVVTATYQFGPPRRTGQWLLGAAGPVYACIASTTPLLVFPGLLMLYVGSSQ